MNLEDRLRAAGHRLDEATEHEIARRQELAPPVHRMRPHGGRLLALAAALALLVAGGAVLALRLRDRDHGASGATPSGSDSTLAATPVPVTTVPDTTSPVTTSPVTTSPVTTSPVTTVPDTTSPVTTSPDTTVPGTVTATTAERLTGVDTGQDYANGALDLAHADGKVDQQLADLGAVQLQDGVYEDAALQLHLQVLSVRSADLDGDGVLEDVVALAWDGGGTGRFTDVLVFRPGHGGADRANAVLVTDTGVGDRAYGGLDSVTVNPEAAVADGRLLLEQYDTDTAACCPTTIAATRWKLVGNQLVQVGQSARRALVQLGTASIDSAPVAIQFLPGTERATIGGDAADASPATIVMRAGQHLLITLADGAAPGTQLTVTAPSGAVLGTARPGQTFDAVVAESGASTITATLSGPAPAEGAWFEADVTVR